MRPRTGDLYWAIDHNGERNGIVLFVDVISPGKLSYDEVPHPTLWHFQVLKEGCTLYLDTSNWSLQEVGDE